MRTTILLSAMIIANQIRSIEHKGFCIILLVCVISWDMVVFINSKDK